MSKSEIFITELSYIDDESIKRFVTIMLDKYVPDYFYYIPASASGKYHPQYALGEGGLVRHTKAAVRIAHALLGLQQYSDLNSDEIIAALILHDTFKCGSEHEYTENPHTLFTHPLCAMAYCHICNGFEHILSEKSVSSIAKLIWSHMGEWNNPGDDGIELPLPVTTSQQFVHLCDYLASRNFITVEVE